MLMNERSYLRFYFSLILNYNTLKCSDNSLLLVVFIKNCAKDNISNNIIKIMEGISKPTNNSGSSGMQSGRKNHIFKIIILGDCA